MSFAREVNPAFAFDLRLLL